MTTELNQAISNVRRYMDAALSVGHTASQYRLTDGSMSFLFHGDLDVILAALSTPPADDVREALIDAMIDVEVSGGMVEFGKDDRAEAAYLADAILADPGIEVRPRGTVTPPADDVREALVALLINERGMKEGIVADRLLAEFEVRPRGTVTPPADDVREALAATTEQRDRVADHLWDQMVGVAKSTVREVMADAFAAAGITVTAEVRPRGAVTAEAREAEMRELHHFEVEQQLAETIAIVKRAQAAVLRHEQTPASLHMDAILDEVNTEIPSGAEVRPRGTVTDAAALAKAWDEGFTLATRNSPNQPHPLAQSNPYRGEARS